MAKIRCNVYFSGDPKSRLYAIKAVFTNTSLGLHESRDLVMKAIGSFEPVRVETETKKKAIALVIGLRDEGLLATYHRIGDKK